MKWGKNRAGIWRFFLPFHCVFGIGPTCLPGDPWGWYRLIQWGKFLHHRGHVQFWQLRILWFYFGHYRMLNKNKDGQSWESQRV